MEKGLVTKVEDKMLVVKMKRTDACDKCRACSISHDEKEMYIDAENLCNATVGDYVGIQLSIDIFFRAILLMYGVPFLFFIAGIAGGYGVSYLLFEKVYELIPIGMGIALLVISYCVIKVIDKKIDRRQYIAKAIEIIEEGSEDDNA